MTEDAETTEVKKEETRLAIPAKTDVFRRVVPGLESQWETAQCNSHVGQELLKRALERAGRQWLGEAAGGKKEPLLKVSQFNAIVGGVRAMTEIANKLGEAVLAHGGVKKEKVIEAYSEASRTTEEVLASLKARASGRKEK